MKKRRKRLQVSDLKILNLKRRGDDVDDDDEAEENKKKNKAIVNGNYEISSENC